MSTLNDESVKSSRGGTVTGNEISAILEKLKNMHQQVNWKSQEERYKFISKLYPTIIRNCDDGLPNLRDVFRPDEIELLLTDSLEIKSVKPIHYQGVLFIYFVARCGYKDKPDINLDGRPSSRRTTPLHHASKYLNRRGRDAPEIVSALFQIYDRFDVNYTDEFGLTHFHVACEFDCDEVVESFLVHRQDPNCQITETGDTPLHLALRFENKVIDLLLRFGADPHLTNSRGFTSLHEICWKDLYFDNDLLELYFRINKEINQAVRIDAQDKLGRTPLHLALDSGFKTGIELLLKNGADPNLVDNDGSTPLHTICKKDEWDDTANLFFKINLEKRQTVQVNAVDKLGRTPLQWAVANLMPNTVDLLLDHGADLSSFVFPTENYFAKRFKSQHFIEGLNLKVKQASGALTVLERLEKRGYELNRSDILTIMKFFAERELFEKSPDIDKWWYDHEDFKEDTIDLMMDPSLSLYEFIRLRPEEAEKRFTCSDYFKFALTGDYELTPQGSSESCAEYLCELMSKSFFRCWALEFFSELTRYRLPLHCCELIIKQLMNKDLCNICLAALCQSS